MNNPTISPPRSSSPRLLQSENTLGVSNTNRTMINFHTQSLSSLNNLKWKSKSSRGMTSHPPELLRHTNQEPTSIVETKDALLKQAMLEKLQKQTEAFYQRTHHKPPMHPLPSHTPPTVPTEFNFVTNRRSSSRDKIEKKNSGQPQQCRKAALPRSRSVTAFNKQPKRGMRSASRGSGGRSDRRGRSLTKPAARDNKTARTPSTGQSLSIAAYDAGRCKQEIDLLVKQEHPSQSTTLTSSRSLTTPLNIALKTEARVVVWQQRRQMRAEKEHQKRLTKEKEDAERETMLKREVQITPIKANPMPFFPAPPLPARSTKPLTQPVAPRLTIVGRAHRRNNSSGALEE